jgi:hypothetical protein
MTTQNWKEKLEDFCLINEMYIRGFPVGKLESFIESLLKEQRLQTKSEIEKIIEKMDKGKEKEFCRDCYEESEEVEGFNGDVYHEADSDMNKKIDMFIEDLQKLIKTI